MASPYLGEIRMFGGSFAPVGWMFCAGQTLPISEYDALFSLLGTTYGGDGVTTFNLPDLRGRVPLHQGTNQGTTFMMGQTGGTESVTLTTQQMPSHNHSFMASTSGANSNSPVNSVSAESVSLSIYEESSPDVSFYAGAIGPAGGGQPHDNMQPYLCVTFIISLYGVYPSQT